MKILIYSTNFLPRTGGVQTVVSELARGLAQKAGSGNEKIEVTVVTRTAQRMEGEDSLPYRLVRAPAFRELLHRIRDADIVHLAGPAMLPLALGLLFRKPVIVEHHGYQSICPNGLLLYGPDRSVCPGHFMAGRYGMCVRCNAGNLGWAKSLFDLVLTFPRRWMCRRAARNIAVTQHVLRRIALPRTEVIYHGIAAGGDCAAGDVTDGDCAGGDVTDGDRTPLKIGYVGRLVAEKGLPVLLQAAKRLDSEGLEFQLTFVGDGPERADLEALARNLQFRNRVEFAGELRGAELAAAVRQIHVVVMPSQWEETAGLAAMEQMMRGGVVVAADIGGLGEVVADAGLQFRAGDTEALCSCLREAIQSPSLRKSLGSAARERAVQAFGRDSMIDKHLSLYGEVLSE